MIRPQLLEILVCPETKQKVREATPEEVASFNAKIALSLLKNRAGSTIKEAIDGALVRVDGKLAYPVRDDIPVMLIEEAFYLA